MSDIHPTAIIDDSVKLGSRVKIGPYCCVTGNVELGDEVVLESHVIVTGNTKIGAQTHIYPFASIGHVPQDLKFGDEEVFLEVGERNRIREHVTMNPGTHGGGGLTQVGNDGLFMMGAHVAHDCIVGNNVILANNATLGGHVSVGDFAILGGGTVTWEKCVLGLPSLVVSTADNQLNNLTKLHRLGAHISMGSNKYLTSDNVKRHLLNLDIAALTSMSNIARGITDGMGSDRLANLLVGN